MLIDTHCHLNFEAFEGDCLKVAEKARQAGVFKIVVPGSSLDTSRAALETCKVINTRLDEQFAFSAVGIHPVHVSNDENFDNLVEMARSGAVVALGECGLDRFHENDASKLEEQGTLFRRHIDLALELNLPLIVHNRKADDETVAILQSYAKLPRMVFHCFSTNWRLAEKVLNFGALISFTGSITYNNKDLKKVVKSVPLDKLMVETDTPYLVPEPLRSQGINRNEPAYVEHVARQVAQIKEIDFNEVCTQTTQNAKKFFGI